METVKTTLSVGGHRALAAQQRARILEDAVTDVSEDATQAGVEQGSTAGGQLALIPAMMNIAQAAAYIGIAKSTLYTWRTRRPGFGPRAVKAGGALRYRRSDLDAWIEAHAETLDLDADLDVDDGRDSNEDRSSASSTLGLMSRRSRPRRR